MRVECSRPALRYLRDRVAAELPGGAVQPHTDGRHVSLVIRHGGGEHVFSRFEHAHDWLDQLGLDQEKAGPARPAERTEKSDGDSTDSGAG